MKMSNHTHITHPFGPFFDAESEILILGSLPSVKSREQMFFYGHPQNRFWPLVAALFGESVPSSVEEKKALAQRHRIALWDTIYSCDIIGSDDNSIKNVVPTELGEIIAGSRVSRVFCNGRTSGLYYKKFHEKKLGIEARVLPSTSPANAAWTFDRLIEAWGVIIK